MSRIYGAQNSSSYRTQYVYGSRDVMIWLLSESVLLKLYQYLYNYGPGSSVGIATGYVLDGPGIESLEGGEFSHTSRPVLGLTQPSVQCVPGLSRG
jgi:hypothetical protein